MAGERFGVHDGHDRTRQLPRVDELILQGVIEALTEAVLPEDVADVAGNKMRAVVGADRAVLSVLRGNDLEILGRGMFFLSLPVTSRAS